MRTKNAKRLWPVPVTLGVMALAALLAFGLMATNGAQPAAAQDADCKITIDAGSQGEDDETLSVAQVAGSADRTCDAVGDTAVIEIEGPDGSPNGASPIEVYILVEDKAGNLSFYGTGDVWQSANAGLDDEDDTNDRRKGRFYASATDQMEVKPTKYFEHNVTVPRASRSGGRFNRQSTTLSVKGEGTVHVYLPDDYDSDIVTDFGDADCQPECDDNADPPTSPPKAVKFANGQPAGDTSTITITFLGVPSLGEDHKDNDRNDILDDYQQCVIGPLTDDTAGTDLDGIADNCTPAGDDTTDDADTPESRSKLVVMSTTSATDADPLIGGGSLTHDMGERDEVSIHAVVEDAKGNDLQDLEVTFTATTNPAGIVAPSDLTDEEDTEAATTTFATGVDGITDGDAVATYSLDDLSDIEGSYTITVEVMVGSLNLGTVVLSRAGDPETLAAGVFNIKCFTMGDADDYSDATFNAKNKGCDASGMASRCGHGETFAVKAHLEDARGIVVGEAKDLDAEMTDKDDDLLGDADIVENNVPVKGKTMPRAWFFTVDDDATLGEHMITVSTERQNAEDEAIDDATVTVIVAGPPVTLDISGDANIPLNGSQTFTVTAKDMIDGIPHLTTQGDDQNDMVTVSVQPTDALVVGANASNQVMLDEDTGTAEFVVYASLDADDGDNGRIIVRLDDAQDILSITFGTADTGVGDELTAPTGIIVSKLGNTITVSWTPNSAQNATQIKAVLFDEGVTRIVQLKPVNPAAGDPGIAVFTGVEPGTYNVVVAAYRPGESHKLSDRHEVTIE